MNPEAFEIFGISVKWYGIIISIGMLIGVAVALQAAKRKNVSEDTLLDLVLVAIPLSLLGARLYYVAFKWDYYGQNPSKILNFRGGGLAIHGGILAAILVGAVFAKIKDENFWVLADIAAPSLILGQAIGRWGNYINGEAHGGPTDLPWGIMVDGIKVHPTFLYESLWNFIVFGFLVWYSRNKSEIDGEVFLLYLILYSIARFFIESLRTDSLMWGNIKVAQLISVILIVISGIILYKKREKHKLNKLS